MINKTIETSLGSSFSLSFHITSDLILNFSSITGDENPIHLDKEFANKMGFKNRIAPGMLIASFIATILGNDFPGSGTVYLSQTIKFLSPVFIDDIITVEIEVNEVKHNGWLGLKTLAVNQDGNGVLKGEAIVIPPKIN